MPSHTLAKRSANRRKKIKKIIKAGRKDLKKTIKKRKK